MVSQVHQRLRDATRADHERLEARLDILRRVAAPEARLGLVESFFGFHAAAEAALAPWLGDLPGLDFSDRRRTAQLREDLSALGGSTPGADAGHEVAARSLGEALGLMYVLEGSTLGGRAIRRAIEAAGGDFRGLSFLDPYGDRAGERWRGFLEVLVRHTGTPAEAEAAVAGGVAGFRHAERRLCGAAAHG